MECACYFLAARLFRLLLSTALQRVPYKSRSLGKPRELARRCCTLSKWSLAWRAIDHESVAGQFANWIVVFWELP